MITKFSNNESVEKIIEIANKNEKTYILAIGGLTNISYAINNNPSIIGKVDVIWLGGNALNYGNNKEFNFMQDTKATFNVINSNINMTIIPARNVAVDLMIKLEELEQKLDMNKEISKYLCNRFVNDSYYGVKTKRVIWDISVIAYLKNKEWFKTEENLKLLCMVAKQNGIKELYDTFETDRINVIKIFQNFGFKLVSKGFVKKFDKIVETITMKIEL